jgi:hypothetical protein
MTTIVVDWSNIRVIMITGTAEYPMEWKRIPTVTTLLKPKHSRIQRRRRQLEIRRNPN